MANGNEKGNFEACMPYFRLLQERRVSETHDAQPLFSLSVLDLGRVRL